MKITHENNNTLILAGRTQTEMFPLSPSSEALVHSAKWTLRILSPTILMSVVLYFLGKVRLTQAFEVSALSIPVFITILVIYEVLKKEKIIINKVSQSVTHQEILNGKVKSETNYSFSRITGVIIKTDTDYNRVSVRLRIQDIGNNFGETSYKEVISGRVEATGDHQYKIALANRLANFIGVPVFEY